MDIKEKVKNLPASPGTYIMKDASGNVLYVGKANNLRKRVSSYFRPNRRLGGRIEALVRHVDDIDYIRTSTEAEALIYENSLIKRYSPKYNVALRDDKSYPMLKLTASEKFPRLLITRRKKDDASIYYGPYTDAKLLRKALSILRALFGLRTCVRMPKKVCLSYHIKQCLGPCAGLVSEARYAEFVEELKFFLDGKKEELLKSLTEKMLEESKRENFEEASRARERIEALGAIGATAVSYAPADEALELKNILGMDGKLETIEAFDISNIMGKEAVGSMISFYKARPKKSAYKRFRIKTVSAIDDYAMMREVIRRRYSKLAVENGRMPDLVLIDGGRGHISAARDELEKLGLSGVPAIGIAKEFEHIYLKNSPDPMVLPKESKALNLLKRIRDEAHRFAITYHKKLLSKKVRGSELDAIDGVGPKRRRVLLRHFGSVDAVRAARLEELMGIEGIDDKTARSIISYFKE